MPLSTGRCPPASAAPHTMRAPSQTSRGARLGTMSPSAHEVCAGLSVQDLAIGQPLLLPSCYHPLAAWHWSVVFFRSLQQLYEQGATRLARLFSPAPAFLQPSALVRPLGEAMQCTVCGMLSLQLFLRLSFSQHLPDYLMHFMQPLLLPQSLPCISSLLGPLQATFT